MRLTAVLFAALALASQAHAGGPTMLLGATEDAVRAPTVAEAKVQMDSLVLAGFRAVRVTQVWTPGEASLSDGDRSTLESVAAAAALDGVTVVTSVVNASFRTAPLTETDQADFAAYAASIVRQIPSLSVVIVGNEPNLNRYWLPQFDDGGADVAALAYESLLAQTYDTLKAASPLVTVVGGALAPRGGDVGGGIRPTHSPTAFIRDLGEAYRASGRIDPIMDALSIHPYEDNSSIAPVAGTHPKSTSIAIADYDKLESLLTEAFGEPLPLYYDEFGVESQIPEAEQLWYTGTEVDATKPVDEATQAAYYMQAVQLAFCQPLVQGLFLFHAVDETALAGWQSGVYYADGTAKASLPGVRLALDQARRGVVATCPGLRLAVHAKVSQKGRTLRLTCDLDCTYVAQLYSGPRSIVAATRGLAVGRRATALKLRAPASRSYHLRVSAVAAVNPGKPSLVRTVVRRG